MPKRRAGGNLAQAARLLSGASDDQLLALTAAGNSRAFEMIVERYRPALMRFCGSLTEAARVDDAVQQTFISAWLAIDRGVLVRDLRPWLYRIARNAAIDQLRARGAGEDPLPLELVGGSDPAQLSAGRTSFEDVLRAVADLPERQRVALLETAVHGRSTDAVADDLGVTGGAIRQLVHRARTTVRTTVAGIGAGPFVGWWTQLGADDGGARRLVTVLGGAGTGTVAALSKTTVAVMSAGAIAAGGVVSTEHRGPAGAKATARTTTDTAPSVAVAGASGSGAADAAGTSAAGTSATPTGTSTSGVQATKVDTTVAQPAPSQNSERSAPSPTQTPSASAKTGNRKDDGRTSGTRARSGDAPSRGGAASGPEKANTGSDAADAPASRRGGSGGAGTRSSPSTGGDGGGNAWNPPSTASATPAVDVAQPTASAAVDQPVQTEVTHPRPSRGTGTASGNQNAGASATPATPAPASPASTASDSSSTANASGRPGGEATSAVRPSGAKTYGVGPASGSPGSISSS